jgi:ubiquinone biosynthesis accessory factor UbiJ
MSHTVTMAALASAERIINLALRYDPATRLGLAALRGKVIAINTTQPKLTLYVIPGIDQLRLASHYEGTIDLSISGSLVSLVNLSLSSREADTFNLKNAAVAVNGDLGLLADLYGLLKNLDIDWEEILCELMEIIRTQTHWTQNRKATVRRLFSEFLTEEIKVLPSKPELENFYHEVDELRLAVDRAAARIERLAL